MKSGQTQDKSLSEQFRMLRIFLVLVIFKEKYSETGFRLLVPLKMCTLYTFILRRAEKYRNCPEKKGEKGKKRVKGGMDGERWHGIW